MLDKILLKIRIYGLNAVESSCGFGKRSLFDVRRLFLKNSCEIPLHFLNRYFLQLNVVIQLDYLSFVDHLVSYHLFPFLLADGKVVFKSLDFELGLVQVLAHFGLSVFFGLFDHILEFLMDAVKLVLDLSAFRLAVDSLLEGPALLFLQFFLLALQLLHLGL